MKFIHDFDSISGMQYGDMVKDPTGSRYIVPIDNEDELLFQFPEMTLQADLDVKNIGSTVTFHVDDSIHENLRKVRDYVLRAAEENSKAWFQGRDLTSDTLRELWKSGIDTGKSGTNSIRVNTPPQSDEDEPLSVYSQDKQEITEGTFRAGTRVYACLRLSHIWFSRNHLGVTWTCVQMLEIEKRKEVPKPRGCLLDVNPQPKPRSSHVVLNAEIEEEDAN